MKLGVIDLGTNTFHLLIVEIGEGQSFKEIFRKRMFIQLAEGGIEKIGPAPFNRALAAMMFFQEKLEEHQVTKVKALGTAALRTASNGPALVEQVLEQTGIAIELIDGNEEARLICEGVRLAVPITSKPVLIMDIGGGSVEFIIANDQTQFWAQSFPIGVAVLYKTFHKSNPISAKEIQEVDSFLKTMLQPLSAELDNYDVGQLVGASGTFDVLEEILVTEKPTPYFAPIPATQFLPVYDRFLSTTLEERFADSDIPDQRAELIIVALILIKFVLELSSVSSIWVSAFAMKEGVLADLQKQ